MIKSIKKEVKEIRRSYASYTQKQDKRYNRKPMYKSTVSNQEKRW